MTIDYGIKRSPKAPVFNTAGAGGIGPDLEGAVKGDMLRQQYMLNQNQDARAEETLGIAKEELGIRKDYLKIAQQELGLKFDDQSMKREEFGWKRQDRDRQQNLLNGMSQAASEGGYEGVIDFLKIANPEEAIKMHAEKLKLDNAIMSNDVMKAVTPNLKNQALLESYGVIGKMGQAILNAPEKDRQNMFNTMQPMLQKVFGRESPKTLEEAAPYYMLAVAQNTPENILYASNKQSALLDTEVGKYTAAQQQLLKQGHTENNSQALRDVNKHLQALRDKDTQIGVQSFLAQTKMNDNVASRDERVQKNTESFNKTLESSSKDYLKAFDSYSQVKAHIESLKKDPSNSYSQSVLKRMFIKSVNSGAMSLGDEALGEALATIPGMQKKIQNMTTGKDGLKIELMPQEALALANAWEISMKGKYDRQKSIEQQYLKSADEYSNVDQQALRLPSIQYDGFLKGYDDNSVLNKYGFTGVPESAKADLVSALKTYKDNPQGLEYVKGQYQKLIQGMAK